MGLFSKKEFVCEKCGKTFQKRINLNGNLCDDCFNREQNLKTELEETIFGYTDYANQVLYKSYSSDEMRQIIEHRDNIIEKYKNDAGISRAELQNISDNYKKLTDEEAQEALLRVSNSTLSINMGAAYTGDFFASTDYEGVFVDAADVFAVGYTTDYRLESGTSEVILCAIFTNDPFFPVFPMIYTGRKGFLEFSKSKEGRTAVNIIFETTCPNLTYPVGDIKQLKKQIKQDGAVKGNIEMDFMLNQISNLSVGSGIFNTKKMYSVLPERTKKILDRMGYISDYEVDYILHMDKMFNRNFWNKQIEKLSKKKR